ncbi:hypothetical protein, partial [Frigidibacter oleivorans]|uniref:hypothetical protein n=1 Tax=Frigidibacter oleivorans TaxID=2487129 RepID=UPI00197A74B1
MQTPAPIRKYPLTEAEHTATGRRTGRKTLKAKEKLKTRLAGRAASYGAPVLILSGSLTIWYTEEICGRFGLFRRTKLLHIGSLAFW